MLRLDNSSQQNPSLWETVLPPELFQMNEELTQVDKLLDDERFFAPFRERFNTRMGRPTTAVATYLRMMYIKHRYQLGYEVLVKEVSDSLAWRRFCHLDLGDRVPDSTTLKGTTIRMNHMPNFSTIISLRLSKPSHFSGPINIGQTSFPSLFLHKVINVVTHYVSSTYHH